MITNLFSVFDPASSLFIPFNWAIIFIVFILPLYWVAPRKSFILIKNTILNLHYEFKNLLRPTSLKGSTIILIGLFTFILCNNFLGLFPYIFTSTRHLSITLTLSLPRWLSFIIFGWFNHTKHIFAHLVPQSTPSVLILFIVIIESIRNIIRPGTLAVRLTANIIAGHLLITLLGNKTADSRYFILVRLLVVQILLLTLKSAVAIIQSYVFAVLTTLYSREITSH